MYYGQTPGSAASRELLEPIAQALQLTSQALTLLAQGLLVAAALFQLEDDEVEFGSDLVDGQGRLGRHAGSALGNYFSPCMPRLSSGTSREEAIATAPICPNTSP
jgi:hypothetical protein